MNNIETEQSLDIHIHISFSEILAAWHHWLREKHNHLGSMVMKNIREQGDYLIREDFRYWADQPLTKLYNQALERHSQYWSFD